VEAFKNLFWSNRQMLEDNALHITLMGIYGKNHAWESFVKHLDRLMKNLSLSVDMAVNDLGELLVLLQMSMERLLQRGENELVQALYNSIEPITEMCTASDSQ